MNTDKTDQRMPSSTGVYIRWTVVVMIILLLVFLGWNYMINGKLRHPAPGPAQQEQKK
jgi:hypothetical protein